MKFFITLFFWLYSVNNIYCDVLQTLQTTLTSVDNGAGQTGNNWRRYIIGLSSTDNVQQSQLLALMNGTKGLTPWFQLVSSLTSTDITRYIIETVDVGDLQGLTLLAPLSNNLLLKYIELDGRGSISLPSGLPLSYTGSGQGSIGTQGISLGGTGDLISSGVAGVGQAYGTGTGQGSIGTQGVSGSGTGTLVGQVLSGVGQVAGTGSGSGSIGSQGISGSGTGSLVGQVLSGVGQLVGSGSGSIGSQGGSGTGYGYGTFQIPRIGNVVNIVTGLSNNIPFLNTVLQQVSQVTNIVTSVVSLPNSLPILGGLGL